MSNFLLNVPSVRRELRPLFSLINASSVLPILGDVLVTGKDSLSICATDLENVLIIKANPLHQEGELNFCLNGKALKQLLDHSLADTISFIVQKTSCKIENGDFNLKWPVDDPDQFPKTPVISDFKSINIDAKELRYPFTNALKFSSNDDLRPAMTGICIMDYDNILYIVATDAHRLYFHNLMPTPKILKGINIIIPKKGIRTFLQAFTKDSIEIRIDNTYISFSNESTTLISRLIDARYPDWPTVLPNNDLFFSFQRRNLLSFLRMANAFAHPSTHQIILVVNNNGITISGGDKDFENEFNYKMPIYNCNKQFPPFRFGVNLRFLMDIANISKDEYCKFAHSGLPTRAMIIDDCCLLMPLLLNDID